VNQGGNVQALAAVLFGPFFLPFEVTSVLLIVAAIGAMLHGRRWIAEEDVIDLDAEAASDEPSPSEGPAPAEPVPAGEPAS
jgi:NADH-quinone oxidoreductase subunit J